MFDTAIIGTGPAGLSAAITLKMRGTDVLWFGSLDMSYKIEKSEVVCYNNITYSINVNFILSKTDNISYYIQELVKWVIQSY